MDAQLQSPQPCLALWPDRLWGFLCWMESRNFRFIQSANRPWGERPGFLYDHQETGLAVANKLKQEVMPMLAATWLMLSTLLYSLQLSTGSFPKPLTEEEERRYLLLAQQGDLEARNILIERNLRLVAHIMKKY